MKMEEQKDDYSNEKYDGWLISNNFYKRSIAVFLHYWFVNLIVLISFLIIFVILGFGSI
jgi:hypothetical protein